MFTTGLRNSKKLMMRILMLLMRLLKNKKTIVQYIIAILLESKLVHNKEQARLEMHYEFNHKEIMKEIDSYFTV